MSAQLFVWLVHDRLWHMTSAHLTRSRFDSWHQIVCLVHTSTHDIRSFDSFVLWHMVAAQFTRSHFDVRNQIIWLVHTPLTHDIINSIDSFALWHMTSDHLTRSRWCLTSTSSLTGSHFDSWHQLVCLVHTSTHDSSSLDSFTLCHMVSARLVRSRWHMTSAHLTRSCFGA